MSDRHAHIFRALQIAYQVTAEKEPDIVRQVYRRAYEEIVGVGNNGCADTDCRLYLSGHTGILDFYIVQAYEQRRGH